MILECHPSTSSIHVQFERYLLLEQSFIFDIQIAKVLQTLSQAELEKVTHAFISSCLHYCNSFYLGHSQKVHLPTFSSLKTQLQRHNHNTLNLATLQWLPVSYRGYFNFYLFLQVLAYIYKVDLFRPY